MSEGAMVAFGCEDQTISVDPVSIPATLPKVVLAFHSLGGIIKASKGCDGSLHCHDTVTFCFCDCL